MKKLSLLLGVGLGFILGSKAGPRPYEQLEAKARSVTTRPEVQETKAKLKSAAGDKIDEMANRVGRHVPDDGDSVRPRRRQRDHRSVADRIGQVSVCATHALTGWKLQ